MTRERPPQRPGTLTPCRPRGGGFAGTSGAVRPAKPLALTERRFRIGFPRSVTVRLLVGVRLLPEVLAAQVEGRADFDRTVAEDLNLAGQPHLVLVADDGQAGERVEVQVELLHRGLGAEVLR